MNLKGINMFKRHIDEFSKNLNLKNSDFLKMRKKIEKIRMFDVFPSRKDPFDHARSLFQ